MAKQKPTKRKPPAKSARALLLHAIHAFKLPPQSPDVSQSPQIIREPGRPGRSARIGYIRFDPSCKPLRPHAKEPAPASLTVLFDQPEEIIIEWRNNGQYSTKGGPGRVVLNKQLRFLRESWEESAEEEERRERKEPVRIGYESRGETYRHQLLMFMRPEGWPESKPFIDLVAYTKNGELCFHWDTDPKSDATLIKKSVEEVRQETQRLGLQIPEGFWERGKTTPQRASSLPEISSMAKTLGEMERFQGALRPDKRKAPRR